MDDQHEATLQDYIGIVRKHLRMIVLTTLVAGIGALVLSFIIPPTWQCFTTIRIEDEKGGSNPLLQDLAMLSGGGSSIETEIEIIKSRTIAERVIDELGLDIGLTRKQQDYNKTVEELMKNTSVSPVRDANIVKVSVRGKDKEKTRLITNTLARKYVDYSAMTQKTEARSVRDFIGGQLKIIKRELLGSEEDLRLFKEKEGIVSAGQGQSHSSAQGMNSTLIQQSQMVAELKKQKIQLEIEIKTLLQDYTEKNPKVVELRETLSETMKKLSENEEKLKNYQNKEFQLIRLTREASANEEIYKLLLTKYEEAKITESITFGDIRIIDSAIAPEKPLKPRKGKNTILGLVLGLLFSLAGAFLLEYLDDSIKGTSDIDRHIKLPVMGMIPFIGGAAAQARGEKGSKDKKSSTGSKLGGGSDKGRNENISANLISETSPFSYVTEAYRTMRTNIRFAAIDGKLDTILVTSSGPHEGKTTTAANMAITQAQIGNKVLIIDADLRKPMMASAFGLDGKKKGLTDALAGGKNPNGLIQKTAIKNLDLITTGPIPPNPAELLGSKKMKDVLTVLKKKYDIVIIDSPPVIAVTDAQVVGSVVDGVLLVVRSGQTPREMLNHAKELLQRVKAKIIGVALNDISSQNGAYGYGYGKYYHRYYGGKEEEKGLWGRVVDKVIGNKQ